MMNRLFTLLFFLAGTLMLHAQTAEDFNYDVDSTLAGLDGGAGFGAAWVLPKGNDQTAISEGGVTVNALGIASSNNHLSIGHNPGDPGVRAARLLENPVTDDGNTYYMSWIMNATYDNPSSHGSVFQAMIINSAGYGASGPGGQLVRMGKIFNTSRFGIDGTNAGGGGRIDGTDTQKPYWAVAVIHMSGDEEPDVISIFVNPDASNGLDTMDADIHINANLNNGFDAIGFKLEGPAGMNGQLDELRFGASLDDVVPGDLAVAPMPAFDNFNYPAGSNASEVTDTADGWGGPWTIVKGQDPLIVEGGFENFDNLTATSGNRAQISFLEGDNTRVFRKLNTRFPDDGSVYYISFSYKNEFVDANNTVTYLMLTDSETYQPGGPGGQLSQIGKYLNTTAIGVGIGGTFDLTDAFSDTPHMVVAKVITSGDDSPDRVEIFLDPEGTVEPDEPDASWEYGMTLNNGFDAIGIKVEGLNPGVVSEFDDIYVGFDFADVIPSDLTEIENPVSALAFEKFDYTEGDSLADLGETDDGFTGPWIDVTGQNATEIIGRGIVNEQLLVRSSPNSVKLTAPGMMNRLVRVFDTPLDTADGAFWFSTQMASGGNPAGNVGSIFLSDTTKSGEAFQQVIIGKQFNSRNLFVTGLGQVGGATQTGEQFEEGSGRWVVGRMTYDTGQWALDLWVDPNPNEEPLEDTANIVNKRFAGTVYNAIGIRAEGSPGVEFFVDDIYFGRNFSDVVPLDLEPVPAKPGGAIETFDYADGESLEGANGGAGFSEPWTPLVGPEQSIAEGGIQNFFILQETSTNRIAFTEDNTDRRWVRKLDGAYGDVGRTFWVSQMLDPNFGGGNVAYLVLADSERFGAGGPGGQLVQIGKAFQGGIGMAPEGNAEQVAIGVIPDTAHFLLTKIVTNGTPARDVAYLWVDPDPSTEPSIDSADVVITPNLTGWDAIGFKIGGGLVAPEWDDIYIGNAWADVIPNDWTELEPPAIPVPAFDVFDYAVGEDLNSQDGGEGWAGPWAAVEGNASVSAGSIESDRVNPEGNKVVFTQSGSDLLYARSFKNPFGVDRAESVWFSFLLDITNKDIGNNANVALWDAVGPLFSLGGIQGLSNFGVAYKGGAQEVDNATSVTGIKWLVGRLDIDENSMADLKVWIDPSADAIPVDGSELFSREDIPVEGGLAAVGLSASGVQTASGEFDAFRIGFSYRDISNKFGSDDPDLIAYEPFNYDVGSEVIGAGGVNAFWEGPWFDKGNLEDNIQVIGDGSLVLEGFEPVGNKARFEYNTPGTQMRVDRELAFPIESDGRTYWMTFLMFTEATPALNNVGNITLRSTSVANKDGQMIAFGRIYGTGNIGLITPQNNTPTASEETPDIGLNWIVVKMATSGTADPDTIHMWVNPDPTVEPDTSTAVVERIGTALKSGIDIVRLKAEGAGADQVPYNIEFDEIKIATAWESASFTTSTIEVKDDAHFELRAYPNPAQDRITIDYVLEKPGELQVDLFDIRGTHAATLVNERQTSGNQQLTMDISQMVNGIYIMRIRHEGKFTTRKLIIYR